MTSPFSLARKPAHSLAHPPSISVEAADLPPLYSSLRVLDRIRDAQLRYNQDQDFSFAAKANVLPILAVEIPVAACSYPVAFMMAPDPVPVIIMGLSAEKNLFVEPDGRWATGNYVPVYLRRYPFMLALDASGENLVLCMDETSKKFGTQGEQLFDAQGMSPKGESIMKLCTTLYSAGPPTKEFCAAIQQAGLLEEDEGVELISGARIPTSGLWSINPAKFMSLPAHVHMDWMQKGWLGFVYAHIQSSYQWERLVEFASRQVG